MDPEVAALIARAPDSNLWVAEQTAIVHIGAGVDVDEAADYLDAIHAEQARRDAARHPREG
jgi:hypothetical protein